MMKQAEFQAIARGFGWVAQQFAKSVDDVARSLRESSTTHGGNSTSGYATTATAHPTDT